ncbi:hypothetical protein Tco_1262347 [Tanacetum coccineum]
MSITKEQQQALDDALVPREQRLRIGNCNYRLSTIFKPKEPTFQVALDVLSLTPFYQAFLISGSVPAIYMHEFWATDSYHKHCIKFKMNKNNYSFDLETFRDMIQICPNLPGQKFKDPPFKEEILAFIRELGYPGDIKSLSDVKVDTLYQPWRTFRTIINKCLSGKVTGLDQLRLSQAQIIWGMYHQKNVDYVYLLWEDLVYQIENKVSKKNKDMYYPRFTKVIINHFMSKDQSIPRRNKYDAILPDTLTNQAMKESDAYKTYHDFATGKVIPKPKYVRRSTREKTNQDPAASLGKRLKATAKVAKSGKKKQPAQGLETLLDIALSEAEQIKIVTKRSKTQFHSSHSNGSCANEGIGVSPGVLDVPTYGYEDEQISWKSSDEDDDDEVSLNKDDDDNADNEDDDAQDDDNEQTESDNDGEDFVHPKFSTHNEEERQDDKDKEEEGSDLRVQTPSHFESTDDETYDEVTQGDNVEGEELGEEETNEEEEVNELYRDVPVNLERRDAEMTNAPQTNVKGFISNMFNPNPDTCIDSILNLNTESTSLVDVPVTTNVEMPPSSVTTLPPPPISHIQPKQQTPVSTPTIVPSTSLQNLPTFSSLFNFEDRVKALEDDFSEFKQTNLFAEAVSSIPGIVDTYLTNKMNEAIKTAVQLQSDRLRNEAQTNNEDFINKVDENIRKIIKEQVKVQVKEQITKILPRIEKSVNEQLKSEVLIHSSNEAKTSHAVEANLSELELKNILIDKMENNKSIDRSSTGKSAQAEEPIHADEDLEEPAYQEFDTGFTEDQPVDETTQHPHWFQKPTKPPTPDRDWNKTLPSKHGPIQPWIRTLAQNEDPRESFNKLMDTPLDFSAFMLNQLKVDTLTPELLASPTFELMKGLCKSLVELEYFLEEVGKATTNQLDWNNPEGQQYPHDLRKPLPLIPNSQGHRVIPFDHFINNELVYLSGGVLSRTYATSVTKTMAVNYGHIKWIEDLVPNTMWSEVPIVYDKHALWASLTGGENVNNSMDSQSTGNLLVIDDDKLYTFKEGDYNRLHLQDIEDMLLLLVQGKLTNLNIEERLALGVLLRMFTRSIVIRRRVEDLHLGIESYQKKLNLTKLDTLMRIDELHKFSDGTLNDVRSALDNILKRIRIEYLPQTVWRNIDRERAGAMIQAIDRQLRNRRLMRSLEKFVGGRLETVTHWFTLIVMSALRCSDNENMLSRSSRLRRIPKDGGEGTCFRHSDTKRLSRSDEVLKLKNLKKDALLKLFRLTYQERYEHVGPEVTNSQDGEVYKMMKGDYAWLMISRSSRSHSYIQVNGTSSSLKSMTTTSIHKLMYEVNDYELKTRVKA